MDSALVVHRLHFAFTATFHYLFPQLTMGLAPLIVILKVQALRRPGRGFDEAARLLARLFAINFVFGVVTGVPMEFQFGTNWARFSRFAGGVIGQTLAMEGMFAFFLESSFLGLFLFGEKRLSPRAHLGAAFAVFAGSWLSGYFIVATDAWMQHPVGYRADANGVQLDSLGALLLNRWAFWQYLHTMGGALVTGAFGAAGLGAYYLLRRRPTDDPLVSRALVRTGVLAAVVASACQLFPTGDRQGQLLAQHQPATLAAMEGLFATRPAAPLVLVGQPNTDARRIDNTLEVPSALSLLTHRRWNASVTGLDQFPPDQRPDNVGLLYYSYHLMVGLGTLFLLIMGLSALSLWRGRLEHDRPLLWALVIAVPLPYIANTAGWITAEVGRQPWLVYGLMRTSAGTSPQVSAGNGLFSLIGFMGLYALLSLAFVLLMTRVVVQGGGRARGVDPAGRSAAPVPPPGAA
ncbi:MAG TPA: cytochrome ubiquinol oxidase subunit I [Polyangia bacterium]|nr:cytochrome ubiquinol oxidase subunit I [Polyangia bacterium]